MWSSIGLSSSRTSSSRASDRSRRAWREERSWSPRERPLQRSRPHGKAQARYLLRAGYPLAVFRVRGVARRSDGGATVADRPAEAAEADVRMVPEAPLRLHACAAV